MKTTFLEEVLTVILGIKSKFLCKHNIHNWELTLSKSITPICKCCVCGKEKKAEW